MSDGMRMKAATMELAAADAKSGAARMQSILDNMDSELSDLKANWTGDGRDAYLAAQVRWNQSLAKMREILDIMSKMISEVSANTTATDRRVAGMWGG